MDKPTVDQAIRFIKKLEASESMAAKLVMLRGFMEKCSADASDEILPEDIKERVLDFKARWFGIEVHE